MKEGKSICPSQALVIVLNVTLNRPSPHCQALMWKSKALLRTARFDSRPAFSKLGVGVVGRGRSAAGNECCGSANSSKAES